MPPINGSADGAMAKLWVRFSPPAGETMRSMTYAVGMLAMLTTIVGCGDDGPSLFEAGGTVTYHGEPLEDATVIFQPNDGPLATGKTDAEGHFFLATRGEPGAVAGPGKIAITAVEQLKEIEAKPAGGMPTEEELAKASRSRIPPKYGNVRTSDLQATVTPDEENAFLFEL